MKNKYCSKNSGEEEKEDKEDRLKMPMSLRTSFIKEVEQKTHKGSWDYMKDFCFVDF